MPLTTAPLPGVAVDIIDDWRHASPTGGFVTTDDIAVGDLMPGMVIRATGGTWHVVTARATRLRTSTGLWPDSQPFFGWHMVLFDDRWLCLWPHSYAQIRTDLHVQEDAL